MRLSVCACVALLAGACGESGEVSDAAATAQEIQALQDQLDAQASTIEAQAARLEALEAQLTGGKVNVDELPPPSGTVLDTLDCIKTPDASGWPSGALPEMPNAVRWRVWWERRKVDEERVEWSELPSPISVPSCKNTEPYDLIRYHRIAL